MSLLVTGSIGIDTIHTPYGTRRDCLGGSAIYFSLAASFFAPVRLVGVIGDDCPFNLNELFANRNVDLTGLELRKGSKTFRWTGTYHNDMNERTTDKLELNVLAEEPPKVPQTYQDSKFVFLANTAPALQIELLEQINRPIFTAADTMSCWINEHRADLDRLLRKIDCLIINDQEARQLTGQMQLAKAAKEILTMGPDIAIIKKGESGSLMYTCDGDMFLLPAYPSDCKDPTGAGDSFAGAFMGYLTATNDTEPKSLRKAVAYGTVVASFAVSDFSIHSLTSIRRDDIEQRLEKLKSFVEF